MLDPFHITSKHVLTAELTPFPAFPPLQPADALSDMFVDLVNSKDKPALPALLMVGLIDTVSQKMIDNFPEVDSAHTLFAADKDLALPEQMFPLIHAIHVHEAVVAFAGILPILFTLQILVML